MYSKLKRLLCFFTLALTTSVAHADTEPNLGKNISTEEISIISMTVFPDGEGLPQGNGTAKVGEEIYNAQCAHCHGITGSGNSQNHVPALAGKPTHGSDWSTGSSWPYATSIFDYIQRAMPPYNVKRFTPDEVYALTAYILKMNGLVDKEQIINQESLPNVEMPASKYFRNKWEEEEKFYQLPSY